MQQQAVHADQLYVLGDLFEAWIGDDAIDAFAEEVIQYFNDFSRKGGQLYFIHGNRDFLLGTEFATATGGTIVDEPHRITVAGQDALLMHGDALCTQDKDYMSFRNQVRNKQWQQQFLTQSIDQRLEIAATIRAESAARGKNASADITDVTQSEVSQLMQEQQVKLLIHGHTHRQARHSLIIDNQAAERIVLGDWGITGSVLVADNNKLSLKNFSLTA